MAASTHGATKKLDGRPKRTVVTESPTASFAGVGALAAKELLTREAHNCFAYALDLVALGAHIIAIRAISTLALSAPCRIPLALKYLVGTGSQFAQRAFPRDTADSPVHRLAGVRERDQVVDARKLCDRLEQMRGQLGEDVHYCACVTRLLLVKSSTSNKVRLRAKERKER